MVEASVFGAMERKKETVSDTLPNRTLFRSLFNFYAFP